ncbi:MAG: trimethylamine methyltransferase family protein [Desulfobacterales bacterium]|jgi:trimethylamine--corrinoid protein Co-methyltransferase
MADFFNDQKLAVIGGLNLLTQNNYRDIHLATLKVLENTGVFVEDRQAREVFGSCGARVDEKNNTVKLPPSMVEDAIQSAPAQVMLAGRNPDRDILLDGNTNAYLNFGGGINMIDPHTGLCRKSTKADLATSARLCDALKEVSVYSRAVYPLDQPQKVLHLHTAEASLCNTTKHCFHGPESEWETKKIIDMAEAVVGGAENLKNRKPISFGSAVSSPLKLTRKFCEAIMTASRAGFTTNIASMAMAGGTGPVNLAGVLVQTNAEILSGIVLTQLVCKGAPVIYASYSTAMDLRWGTCPLGSPETALIGASVAGLCRYYQLPCLVPGISSDSKRHGIQAAYEKALTGVSAAMAGASLIVGIGGLETGLTFDFGQAVLDDEIVRMIKHLRQGFDVNTETLSVDLIQEIGPFGEFLSQDTTLLKMKSLSQTHLFDRNNREGWENNGKPQSYAKALSRAIDIIEDYQPEPLPVSVVKQIRAIVEEAEKEVNMK